MKFAPPPSRLRVLLARVGPVADRPRPRENLLNPERVRSTTFPKPHFVNLGLEVDPEAAVNRLGDSRKRGRRGRSGEKRGQDMNLKHRPAPSRGGRG